MKPLVRFALLGIAAAGSRVEAQSINITRASLRLYEQDGGFVLGAERRVYATHLDAVRTRFLGVEISLEHSAAAAPFMLGVGCQMTRPDGKVIDGIWKIGVRIGAGATASTEANVLFGAPGGGPWQTGSYQVQCSTGERLLAKTSFDMILNPPDVADAEVRVRGVKFFPSGAPITPPGKREYTDRFLQAQATLIGIEVSFIHPALGRRVEVLVDCYYLTPSLQVLGMMDVHYTAEPTATGGTGARAIGWDQPRNWSQGNYLAVCQINGRPVAIDRFEVR